jgi:hypothetical protein
MGSPGGLPSFRVAEEGASAVAIEEEGMVAEPPGGTGTHERGSTGSRQRAARDPLSFFYLFFHLP